jgi:hypothetical protein
VPRSSERRFSDEPEEIIRDMAVPPAIWRAVFVTGTG